MGRGGAGLSPAARRASGQANKHRGAAAAASGRRRGAKHYTTLAEAAKLQTQRRRRRRRAPHHTHTYTHAHAHTHTPAVVAVPAGRRWWPRRTNTTITTRPTHTRTHSHASHTHRHGAAHTRGAPPGAARSRRGSGAASEVPRLTGTNSGCWKSVSRGLLAPLCGALPAAPGGMGGGKRRRGKEEQPSLGWRGGGQDEGEEGEED